MQQQQFINDFNQLNIFRAIISPILRSTNCVYSLSYNVSTMLPAGDVDEVENLIHVTGRQHTISCKHSLVLLRMGEIIALNMLS